MNALRQAQHAYRSETQPVRTERGAEYEAFARITHRLKAAQRMGSGNITHMAEAVHENRRLWATLASDVAHPDNGLPKELRARILYLTEFSRQHGGKVLRKQATADALIEINTAIMRGLRNGSA